MVSPPEEQAYNPELKDAASGLYCFLDASRACGAECMAYCNPPLARGSEYEGKQFTNCLLLTSAHQTSKHLVAIANLLKKTATPAPPLVR